MTISNIRCVIQRQCTALYPVFIFSLLFVFSCQKDEVITPVVESDNQGMRITSVSVSPDRAMAIAGTTLEFVANGKNANGDVVPNLAVSWMSRDTTVARLDLRGMAMCLREGVTEVYAVYQDTLLSNVVRLDVLPETTDAIDLAKTIRGGEKNGVRVVYTDLDPDLEFKNLELSFIKLDIDQDGLDDFEIQRRSERSGDFIFSIAIKPLMGNLICVDTAFAAEAQTAILEHDQQPANYMTFFQSWAYPIDEDELINKHLVWRSNLSTLYYSYRTSQYGSSVFGNWSGKLQTHHIGVKLIKSKNFMYGWIKLGFNLSVSEYAYRE